MIHILAQTPGTAPSLLHRPRLQLFLRHQCDVQSPRLHRPYAPLFIRCSSSLTPPKIGRVLLVLQDGRAIIVAYPFYHRLIPPILHHLFLFFVPLTDAISLGGAQGVLAGYDQKSNVVLSDSKERVYSLDEGVEEVPLGLYLVKGDMMCVATRSYLLSALSPPPSALCSFPFYVSPKRSCHVLIISYYTRSILIGEIDEERDHAIDHSTIRADPIAPIRY